MRARDWCAAPTNPVACFFAATEQAFAFLDARGRFDRLRSAAPVLAVTVAQDRSCAVVRLGSAAFPGRCAACSAWAGAQTRDARRALDQRVADRAPRPAGAGRESIQAHRHTDATAARSYRGRYRTLRQSPRTPLRPRRMSYPVGKPRPLPRLQLPLVVIIAAASFLAGHYSKGPPRGPAPVAPVGAGAGADSAPRVRAAALAAAARGAPLPEMGPLGEQWLRSSGLLALRPPLAPAASGNAFYTMQPFQLLSWWPRCVGGGRTGIAACRQARVWPGRVACRPLLARSHSAHECARMRQRRASPGQAITRPCQHPCPALSRGKPPSPPPQTIHTPPSPQDCGVPQLPGRSSLRAHHHARAHQAAGQRPCVAAGRGGKGRPGAQAQGSWAHLARRTPPHAVPARACLGPCRQVAGEWVLLHRVRDATSWPCGPVQTPPSRRLAGHAHQRGHLPGGNLRPGWRAAVAGGEDRCGDPAARGEWRGGARSLARGWQGTLRRRMARRASG